LLAAALTGAGMLGLIVWQLAIPRTFYTGTNSVAVSSVVANVNAGERLCVPGLDLPAETGRVQLAVFAQRPRFRANVQVMTTTATELSQIVGRPGPTSLAYANAAIHRRPKTPASVPATVCIVPVGGPIALGGMQGLQANQL